MAKTQEIAKEIAKQVTRNIFRGAALPNVALYRLVALIDNEDDAFHYASQLLSLVPGRVGIYLRAAFYQMTLETCGPDNCVQFGTVLSHSGTRLGCNIYFGLNANIGLCSIGDDCLIGGDSHILSGKKMHRIDDPNVPIKAAGGFFDRVTIGANTWIGNGSQIMSDVGQGCVIGAGSVVARPIPDWSVALGNPAQVVKKRR